MTITEFLAEWCSRGSHGLKAEWIKPTQGGARQPARPAAAPARTEAERNAEVRRLLGFGAIDGDVIEGGGHAR